MKSTNHMNSTTRILLAFILNLVFSTVELVGGLLSGSAAISSDALHAFGDAISTGIAYFLERKSNRQNNRRYSILGAIITSAILLSGALIILESSIERLFEPAAINYEGMTILAIVGVIFSAAAMFITRDAHPHAHDYHRKKDTAQIKQIENHPATSPVHAHAPSKAHHLHHHTNYNQKTVSLHMLQDVFSWSIVLIGSIVIRFSDIRILDPLLSIAVAVFIIVSAIRNLNDILKSISVV